MPKTCPVELMGKIVTVSALATREYVDDVRAEMVVTQIEPRAGWVVGQRAIQTGVWVPTSGGNPWDDDGYEPAGFAVEKVDMLLAVVFWPTQREVFVPPSCITLGGTPISESKRQFDQIRRRDPSRYAEIVQELRQCAKEAPRDAFGRFTRFIK